MLLAAQPLLDEKKPLLQARIAALTAKRGFPPHLSVLLLGEDPASQIYVRNKHKRALELGMTSETILLPASTPPAEVQRLIETLNQNERVDGILLQRPLPQGFSEDAVSYWVTPKKDVDAFHPENVGRLSLGLEALLPCTPAGIMSLLAFYRVPVAGKVACVVGRSSIVGKPMANLLLQANATVVHCHSRTQDLQSLSRQADILVVAAGKPGLIGGEHVGPGAVVIDVGIHRDAANRIVGDVRFDEVSQVASALTPVPGGVGPLTILHLLENTVLAAERSLS